LGMLDDITERKRAEVALRESEDNFRSLSQEFNALLDAIPDNLTLQSSDLKLHWVNKGAANVLGKEVSDLTGQYCYKLWHDRSTPCPIESCPVQRSFLTGNPESGYTSTPDGRVREMRSVPIKDENGEVINVIEVARDITEQRKLEAQLRHSQKMEAIGELAGGIAHEFNNILTAITGYGDILLMNIKEDDPLRRYIEQILASSERAASLTRGLLAYGRKQMTAQTPLDINRTVKSVEELLSRIISEDIELRTILTDEDLTVMADSGQMEQVLINLATNARDAMPDGGVMTIETRRIKGSVGRFMSEEVFTPDLKGKESNSEMDFAEITVTDTGFGMDKERRERIFDPFFTTKEVGKGTGLGLAIVYGIINSTMAISVATVSLVMVQHSGYTCHCPRLDRQDIQ